MEAVVLLPIAVAGSLVQVLLAVWRRYPAIARQFTGTKSPGCLIQIRNFVTDSFPVVEPA